MMTVPEWFKLSLYMIAPVVPIWSDFFAKSNDFTFRGLMMPALSSLTSAVAVLLARTKARSEQQSNNNPPAQ